MSRTIILRFRDLVTEEGGTIEEHKRLIEKYGEAWWGWWKRQSEFCPNILFREVSERLENKEIVQIYLCNAETGQFYCAKLKTLLASPSGRHFPTPDAARSPAYYHRGKYCAWFLLESVEEVRFHDHSFFYESFPTRPQKKGEWSQLFGQGITSVEQLKHIDVTLWVVSERT